MYTVFCRRDPCALRAKNLDLGTGKPGRSNEGACPIFRACGVPFLTKLIANYDMMGTSVAADTDKLKLKGTKLLSA
jgi:hypothetical protein